MLSILLVATSLAQDAAVQSPAIDAQAFRHSVDAKRTLWTDDATLPPPGYFGMKFGFNYMKNPLLYYPTTGGEVGVLTDASQVNLIPHFTFWRIRAGLDVPLYVQSVSETSAGGAGLGDLALDLKGVAVDPADANGLGVALSARVGAPTGSVDASLSSDGPTVETGLILSEEVGPLILAGNIGHRIVPPQTLDNIIWGNQVVYRVGVGVGSDAFGGSVDLAGLSNYQPPRVLAGNPLEAMVGVHSKVAETVALRAGGSTALTSGVASPDFRAVFTVAYEPPFIRDRDLDGIVDKMDDCVDEPEDKDNYKDDDGCPDLTTKVKIIVVDEDGNKIRGVRTRILGPELEQDYEDVAEFTVHPDNYVLGVVAPGFETVKEKFQVPDRNRWEWTVKMVPKMGGFRVAVTDTEGNPLDATIIVPDRDPVVTKEGAGLVEKLLPGPYEVMVSANGYKVARVQVEIEARKVGKYGVQLESSKVLVTKEQIEIGDKVYFETNQAVIKAESYELLNDVADTLLANAYVKKVSIEGHTDASGSDEKNQTLSEDRAAAVRDYLVKRGVQGERLSTKGYGESQPVARGHSQRAYAQNRRVEFVIVEQDLTPIEMDASEVEGAGGE